MNLWIKKKTHLDFVVEERADEVRERNSDGSSGDDEKKPEAVAESHSGDPH